MTTPAVIKQIEQLPRLMKKGVPFEYVSVFDVLALLAEAPAPHEEPSSDKWAFQHWLDAPCRWCGYSGPNYWQVGTHGETCPWRNVGGAIERADRLGYTRIPESMLRAAALHAPETEHCRNCRSDFMQNEARYFYGLPDEQVGPLCEACDLIIKRNVSVHQASLSRSREAETK